MLEGQQHQRGRSTWLSTAYVKFPELSLEQAVQPFRRGSAECKPSCVAALGHRNKIFPFLQATGEDRLSCHPLILSFEIIH
jgi:hypothetical protein